MNPLLQARDLAKHYDGGRLKAVDGVSLAVFPGETLAVVGESGCGKSSLARCLARLIEPTAGELELDGRRYDDLSQAAFRPLRRRIQFVFQDALASLNPRMTVLANVAEPLRLLELTAAERAERARACLSLVALSPDLARRYPHQLSGGQRQRVGIARALAPEPALVILDEPVSALDVSVQAGVLNLLSDLRERLGMAYLFIAHDLGVVNHLADRVAVMYLGSIVEEGPREAVFGRAQHPYTLSLLSAIPIPDPERERHRQRIVLAGDPPRPTEPPPGCKFSTRCWKAQDRCRAERPALRDLGPDHRAACHYPGP